MHRGAVATAPRVVLPPVRTLLRLTRVPRVQPAFAPHPARATRLTSWPRRHDLRVSTLRALGVSKLFPLLRPQMGPRRVHRVHHLVRLSRLECARERNSIFTVDPKAAVLEQTRGLLPGAPAQIVRPGPTR